jgi:hypothetical protein
MENKRMRKGLKKKKKRRDGILGLAFLQALDIPRFFFQSAS